MLAKLFKNGQSMAIRLPAQWVKTTLSCDSVQMELKKDGSLVLKPNVQEIRNGWAEAAVKISSSDNPDDNEWIEAGVGDGLEGTEW